jgi:hypothetical protein
MAMASRQLMTKMQAVLPASLELNAVDRQSPPASSDLAHICDP